MNQDPIQAEAAALRKAFETACQQFQTVKLHRDSLNAQGSRILDLVAGIWEGLYQAVIDTEAGNKLLSELKLLKYQKAVAEVALETMWKEIEQLRKSNGNKQK